MNKFFIIIVVSVLSIGCSDSSNEPNNTDQAIQASHLNLPTSTSEKMVISGEMIFWMYEGSAGCYGDILVKGVEINLWINENSCGEKEFKENQAASVEITFNPKNQYGPGKTYTITSFK